METLPVFRMRGLNLCYTEGPLTSVLFSSYTTPRRGPINFTGKFPPHAEGAKLSDWCGRNSRGLQGRAPALWNDVPGVNARKVWVSVQSATSLIPRGLGSCDPSLCDLRLNLHFIHCHSCLSAGRHSAVSTRSPSEPPDSALAEVSRRPSVLWEAEVVAHRLREGRPALSR